jgi:peptidoglycan/xylan/chitin deacetylase (PgdA/CDA1 family)
MVGRSAARPSCYADNLLLAKPLLERHGISATVFIATGHTGAARELWNDELARILLTGDTLPASLELDVEGQHHRFDLPADAGRDARLALYYEVWRLLVVLRVDVQQAVLEALRDWAGMPGAVRPSRRTLTADEVAELAGNGLIEVGAHTVNHVDLSAAPASVQKAEIEDSKAACEAILDRPVISFAYPYGRVGAASPPAACGRLRLRMHLREGSRGPPQCAASSAAPPCRGLRR